VKELNKTLANIGLPYLNITRSALKYGFAADCSILEADGSATAPATHRRSLGRMTSPESLIVRKDNTEVFDLTGDAASIDRIYNEYLLTMQRDVGKSLQRNSEKGM
jgi:hypothetical protein